MCGRFTLFASKESIRNEYDITNEFPQYEMLYNIAPSQYVLAVIQANNERRIGQLQWGLVPGWASDTKIAYNLINARSETAHSKPSFKRAFESRRCIIPSSGFYEWKKLDGRKQPYLIKPSNGPLFSFAGLWEKWLDEESNPLYSCTILTTTPMIS
jgi:putative SOS response-associated peptidase YedK